MNSAITICFRNFPTEKNTSRKIDSAELIFSRRNQKKILKLFLLERLHQLFCEIFDKRIESDRKNLSVEYYAMEGKIIQLLIQGIIETEEYTLEGIAFHTRIPFDVVYDAACGINNHLSIALWVRVVDLYVRVKPAVAEKLIDKLLEMKDKNHSALSALLSEV